MFKQFSGLKFGPINNEIDLIFNIKNESKNVTDLITIKGHPFFLKIKIKKCNIFFIANNQILDIEEEVLEKYWVIKHFSQIIPVMAFIK